MLRPLFLTLAFAFFSQSASAITMHIDVTPELVGDKGVMMKPLDEKTTRFIIRVSMKNDPETVAPRFPFVRVGSLDVRGEDGRILRCSVQPKEQGGYLFYTFDLENEHAKCSWFLLREHFDDEQVGGGKIFSYRLIDFIDPDYRAKELIQHIRPVPIPLVIMPPISDEPK